MTVKELINKLKEFPEEINVYVFDYEHQSPVELQLSLTGNGEEVYLKIL